MGNSFVKVEKLFLRRRENRKFCLITQPDKLILNYFYRVFIIIKIYFGIRSPISFGKIFNSS